jgi:hypothetical protein
MNTCSWRLGPLVLLSLAFLADPPRAPAGAASQEMTKAAKNFLEALTQEQRAKAAFDFKADDRQDWHYIPKERKGITFKDLDPAQRKLGLALLRSGLSEMGYTKATNIMSLEPILAELEGAGRRFPRDPLLYHLFIFGRPEPKGTWAWRVEGHHLSANFTIVNGEQVAGTPSFLGTNPAEVRQGPRQGLRILAGEEDLGRQLVQSLDAEQRQAAIFSATAPKEIFTEAKPRVQPLEPLGIPAAKLTGAQREKLMKLIEEYVHRVRPELAEADLHDIRAAGVEKILFAWAGGTEKGEGHYYRVQGPTFLLEYDNTQNNNNHIHAVWRDYDGDFGEDLLRKHYQENPHGK